MKNAKAKGSEKERASKKLYERGGWFVTKAGGSLGCADLVCLRLGDRPQLVQVKACSSRYGNFRPAERKELRVTAAASGADAVLAWWAPYAREHELVAVSDWPSS